MDRGEGPSLTPGHDAIRDLQVARNQITRLGDAIPMLVAAECTGHFRRPDALNTQGYRDARYAWLQTLIDLAKVVSDLEAFVDTHESLDGSFACTASALCDRPCCADGEGW